MKGCVIYAALAGIFLLFGTASGLEHGERCQTPNRVSGTCIGVRNCPPLVTLLQAKPVPQDTLNLLRRSQCGFQGRDPLVCCPSTSNPGPPTPTPETEVTEDVSQHPKLRLLTFDICGPIAENRIINGNRTSLNELPWMALVAYTVRSGSPFRCGGTVISSRYVLTAAHCVKFLPSNLKPVSVRLGEHDLESDIDCDVDPDGEPGDKICAPAPQDIRIEEVIAHPRYTGKPNLQNDVALLRLSSPADFRPDSVRPICLPIGLPQQTLDLTGLKVIVSGWGVTENFTTSTVLLKVAVPVASHETCKNAFRGTVPISAVSQLCAGGVRDKGDSCSGDSGGPLNYFGEVQGSSRTVQHGVVSFGPRNCGTPGQPGVYTRVGHFMKWILDNMKD